MYGVLADGELDAHSGKRTAKVVVGRLHILCSDIHGVRIQLCENLRHCFLYEVVYVHGVNILVVDNVKQVVELVPACVYDVQPVA